MQEIVAYNILVYSTRSQMVNGVNTYISEGWQPLGSVIKYSGGDFYQTMVKYKPISTNQI